MALSPNPDTDWLIGQIERFESVATSSQTFNTEDLIEFLNSELQTVLTPTVQSVNEEFGVMYVDYPVESLVGLPSIRIPGSATGARLRNVQLVSNQGYITNIPRLNPDKLGQAYSAYQTGFYIRNNELVFYPNMTALTGSTGSGVVRLSYFRRSNTLTATVNTGRVIDVDLNSDVITLDASPAGADWVIGALIDVIIGTSPYDFRLQGAEIVNINGSVIELASDDIDEIQIGDYVALQGFTPVPQFVPAEAMYLLAQLAATRCLQSLGDTEGFKIASLKAETMKMNLLNLISDRIEGQPKKLSALGMTRRAGSWYGGF